MPEYLSPGVYVEEVDAGPKPIEGVSTSTAGAVGVTVRGPTRGKPELVTSFNEFARKFGGFIPPQPPAVMNTLGNNATEGGRWWQFPLAVKGFFDNGGQRLYVKRVFADAAVASSVTLGQGLVAEVESDAAAGPNPPSIVVRHLFGLSPGSAVTLINGSTGQAIGAGFSIAAYDANTRRVTLNAALPAGAELRAARGDVLVENPPAAGGTVTARALARGEWGDALRLRLRPMVGSTLTLLHDLVGGGAAARAVFQSMSAAAPWTVTVQAAAAGDPPSLTGFANLDRVSIAGNEYEVSSVNAAANTFVILALAADPNWAPGTPVQRLRPASPQPATAQLRMWGASRLYTGAVLELDNGRAKEVREVVSVAGDVVTLSATPANPYLEGHRVRVVEMELTIQYRPGGVVEAEEQFGNLRLVRRAADPNYFVTRVNAASKLIELNDGGAEPANDLPHLPFAAAGTGWAAFGSGADNLDQLSVDDFVGVDGGSGSRTGIQSFEDIDEISLVTAPGMWSRTVHNGLIQHCEALKDRFAVIDPPDGLDIEGIRSFREVYDTKYAALYYPWLVVRDPSVKRDTNVAPSAHMAGLYARVDVERGVYKSPANEVVRGISRLAQDVTKREQDMLNPRNINVLRYFPGRGNRVWGARVLTSDASWKYINVRRLFIYVEESIDEGTQWVVFEPNDEPLWARVRQTITNFLTSEWRKGALQGAKPDEAFFVRCDHSTMTQDDIDNGRLICQIGIAPVKPAEFVIFRIQQKIIESASA